MQAATYATYAEDDFTSWLFERLEGRIADIAEAELVLVARSELGNIVGLAMAGQGPEAWEPLDDDSYVPPTVDRYLKTLFTMPGAQGTGLGGRLLEAVLPDDEPAYLWTMEENPRAVRFYTKHGFVPDGYRKRSGPFGNMQMLRMVRL